MPILTTAPPAEGWFPQSPRPLLRLATLRSHDQYNTTIYSLDDRYRGVFGGRMVVFMNEADMRTRGKRAKRRDSPVFDQATYWLARSPSSSSISEPAVLMIDTDLATQNF